MVNPQFDVKHRLIIKKICYAQIKALSELSGIDELIGLTNEVNEIEGDIEFREVKQTIEQEIITYTKLSKNPNNLFHLLDSLSLAGFKSELLNSFSIKKPVVRKLWRKVFMSETLLTQLN